MARSKTSASGGRSRISVDTLPECANAKSDERKSHELSNEQLIEQLRLLAGALLQSAQEQRESNRIHGELLAAVIQQNGALMDLIAAESEDGQGLTDLSGVSIISN